MMIRDNIIKIIEDIDEEILQYDGPNMFDDGVIDSFTIVELVSDIEKKLEITIKPEEITEEHFKTIDAIVDFVKSRC